MLRGRGADHIPRPVLMDCPYTAGCQTAQGAGVATEGSAWKHPNEFLWALWCDAMGHCVFVLLYVLAVGVRETKRTDFVSRFANCTFRRVPAAWNPRQGSVCMSSCVAPDDFFFFFYLGQALSCPVG